jgi:two-component system, NarL family, sensor histidine kinase FusK
MGKTWLKREWPRHVAVAAGYLLIYMALRPFNEPYWGILSAFRLVCLLFLPYRYWLTLPLMDTVGQSFNVLTHTEFGLSWTIISMIPSILTAMPIVWWCREKLDLFPNRQQINFHVLLLCSALCSLAMALLVLAAVMHSFYSPGHPFPVTWIAWPGVFMGKYIAIIFVLPWALMARAELISRTPWKPRLQAFAKELIAPDTLTLLLSAALFLLWFRLHNFEDARRLSYLATFIPIVWVTLKPGWRATALGGTPAILCTISLLEWHGVDTPYMVGTETFIALVMTCLFILGARVTARRQQEEQGRLDAERAIALARENIHLNELRLRKTAQELELAGSAMTFAHHQILGRFRHLLAPNEMQRYFRQASTTHNQISRLVDSMYPSAWRERGLPAALRETIAHALAEVGIAYRCEIKGLGAADLSANMHTAIYRLACETVAYVNAQMICSRVRLRLRSGLTGKVRWIALCVEGLVEPAQINDAVYDITERQFLEAKLGAHGIDLDGLRNHVQLFGGQLRQRTVAKGIRTTCLLIDEPVRRAANRAEVNPWIT